MNTKNITMAVVLLSLVLLGGAYLLTTGKSNVEEVGMEREDNLLENTSWQWKETLYLNDEVVTPDRPEAFVLSFTEDGKFSAGTDCNYFFGDYEAGESSITFGPIASTKRACGENTQETDFANMLDQADGYFISPEGDLALTLKLDTGSVMFVSVGE